MLSALWAPSCARFAPPVGRYFALHAEKPARRLAADRARAYCFAAFGDCDPDDSRFDLSLCADRRHRDHCACGRAANPFFGKGAGGTGARRRQIREREPVGVFLLFLSLSTSSRATREFNGLAYANDEVSLRVAAFQDLCRSPGPVCMARGRCRFQ